VVNGGVGAERLDYRGLPATRYLLGPAYALLRPEFAAEPAREFAGAVRRVFVAAGGSDPLGLLPRLVGWAHKALPEAGIDVLASPLVAEGLVERLAGVESRPEGRTNAGEDGPALAKIQESDRDGPGTRLRARGRDESRPYTGQGRSKQRPYMAGGPGGDDGADAGWVVIHRDPPDVRGLMLGADVALCAGGQTTYELAATGTPAIAVQVAANQAGNLRGLEAAGALVWAGSVEDADLGDRVMAALAALAGDGARRAAMSRAGRALVDGKGIERVAEALLARAGALQACRE
jgi:spore coat polysaccharide biosynthesis predicted glycosyltransferase SpsG